MAEIKPALPVKYFVAVLYREEEYLDKARILMENAWGRIDIEECPSIRCNRVL